MFAQTRQAKRRIVALVALSQLVFGATAVVISQSASVSRVNAATSFDHVVIGIMENHGYSEIIGSSSAPYENALAQQNALMTQSYAIGHPSEPNYHELWSGSNQGVTDDSCPQTFTTPSLRPQLIGAGLSTAIYSADPPSHGSPTCTDCR